MDATPAAASPTHTPAAAAGRGRWATLWAGTRVTFGALLGLAPHVMHHIGFLASAALLTGVWGNTLLYVAGMLLSLPMLNRLRGRFGSWKAAVIGAALYALSTFVIGPALSPPPDASAPPAPAPGPASAASVVPDAEHDAHHP